MVDDAGFNGIRDDHFDRVGKSLLYPVLSKIDRDTFNSHCYKCGIEPDNFTQSDLNRLQEKLNNV